MNATHDTRPPGGPPPPGSRSPMGGLTRSNDDVVISGLCGGLGRQFGIDPLVFRIAFVVLTLAGGTGILLYLVGWALVPDDRGETFGARWLPGSDRGHKLGAAALAGVGLILLIDQIFDGHGDDVPLGVVLVGVGAAVLWSRRSGQSPTPSSGGWTPTGAPTGPPPPPPPPPAGPPGAPMWPPAPVAGDDAPSDDITTSDPGPSDADPTSSIPTTPLLAGSSSWSEPSWSDPSWSEPSWSDPSWSGAAPLAPLPAAPAPPVHAGPAPRARKPPRPAKPRSALVAVTLSLLAILAGVVVLAGADLVTGLALALFLVSGAMIVGAWRGRARGLIPVALLLACALFVASLVDVPFTGGAGERRFVPVSVAEVQSPYRLVAGELTLDLRNLDLAGGTVAVVASIATGNIVLTVPDDVAVEIDARVGAGDMLVLGRDWSGVGLDERVVHAGREGAGRLVLDLHVGLGQLEVRRAAA